MLRINHMLLLLIFASFHYGLPKHHFLVTFGFYLHLRRITNPPFHPPSVCPSANLSPFHQPHTETRQWGPHPSSVFYDNSALPGARISHWGTRFCICTSFSKKIIYYLLFIVQTLSQYILCRHRWRLSFLAIRNPCRPWIGAVLIINHCRHRPHLQSTQLVSYPYPLNLFTLSRLWHNLVPVLSST
jgi:hypothetical protein